MKYYLLSEEVINELNINKNLITTCETMNPKIINDILVSLGKEFDSYLDEIKLKDDRKVSMELFGIRMAFLKTLGELYNKNRNFQINLENDDYEDVFKLSESQLQSLGIDINKNPQLKDYTIIDLYPTRAEVDALAFSNGIDLDFDALIDMINENADLKEDLYNRYREDILSILETY